MPAENRVMTRREAEAILDAREGFPVAENAHISTGALVAAAYAREGQPCADCEALVVWDEALGDWRHVHTPTSCFLARQDER